MMPQNLKSAFGLKDQKDISMANNIWKMLDDMADSDPQAYKKFIQKNINEGITDIKHEKQQKEKPFKIVPKEGIMMEMDAILNEKVLEERPTVNQKVDLQSVKWHEVRAKFPQKIRIILNLCYSDRVKEVQLKGNQTSAFQITKLKDIDSLYYSMQGPHEEKHSEGINWYFCMIFNDKFYQAFEKVNTGKKLLFSIAVSYFQERIQNDRNPLLKQYNPQQYGKLAFYNIEKMSIELSQEKYKYGKDAKPGQFLLEIEVDKKQRKTKKKQKQVEVPLKKPQIKLRKQPSPEKKQESLPELIPSNKNKKKPMIEVLEETTIEEDKSIPYEMKQTEDGFHFQFLIPQVDSINNMDLQANKDVLKLAIEGKHVQIQLKKPINEEKIKAKHKKKVQKLIVDLVTL